jgi:cytochrome c556
MTALILHGSYERAKFMPQGMRDVGSAMHSNASRLAVAAKDAGATGDLKPVLEAMAKVTAQCVACHSAYRVK